MDQGQGWSGYLNLEASLSQVRFLHFQWATFLTFGFPLLGNNPLDKYNPCEFISTYGSDPRKRG